MTRAAKRGRGVVEKEEGVVVAVVQEAGETMTKFKGERRNARSQWRKSKVNRGGRMNKEDRYTRVKRKRGHKRGERERERERVVRDVPVDRKATGVPLLLSIYFRCIDWPLKGTPSSICDCESPQAEASTSYRFPPPVHRRYLRLG